LEGAGGGEDIENITNLVLSSKSSPYPLQRGTARNLKKIITTIKI